MTALSNILDSRKFLRFLLNHPYHVILFVALVTLVFAWHLPNLRFQTSIYDLAIQDLPETVRYQEFKKAFGTEEVIFVVLKGKNIFESETFKAVDQLSQNLSEIKGVRRTISLPGIKRAMDVTQKWDLADYENIVAPIHLFHKNLISSDRSTTVISLILQDIQVKDHVIASVEKVIQEQRKELTLYQIGMPLVSRALAEYTQKDFMSLPAIAFLIMACILFIVFRNIRAVLIPSGCVLVAIIWTFGLMAWTDTPLSMITMIVPIFVIAVGTAYCMYIFFEYLESITLSDFPKQAAYRCFSNVAFPTSLAVITTLIGLGSLLINRIEAIREFAVFSSFGILSMLTIMLILLPAVFAILPFPKNRPTDILSLRVFFDRFLDMIIRIDLTRQKAVMIIISAITLFGVVGITKIEVETNPVEYFRKDTPISQHFHDIYRNMAGSFPINVVLDSKTSDFFENRKHLALIENLQRFLSSLEGVDKTISFVDYLKLVNYASNQYKPEYYVLPEEDFEIRMSMNSFKTMLGQDVFERFMKNDLSKVNILLRTHISGSRAFLDTKAKILRHLSKHLPEGLDVSVTGFGIVMSQSSQLLTLGQVKSLALTIALIFGVMLLLFLSPKVGLIAILPNCFPIIVNFGLMGWLGIKLSVATSLVASIAIGLSVDDIIHYLVRYNREFKKDSDKGRALRDTLRGMARPIILTSVIISSGFSILLFSHFEPTAVFGLMMVITMISAVVGPLIILPSCMLHVRLVTVWDLLKSVTTFDSISTDIAHELNQPLNAIKMGSEFLKMLIQQRERIPPEQLSQVIHEIDDQVDRASEIVNLLSEFGRKRDLVKELVDINRPIRDVASLFAHQLAIQNIALVLDLDDTISPVFAQRNGLRQIFYNLMTNARDAINEKEKSSNDSAPKTISIRSFQQDNNVVVTVSDTGKGISEDVKKWIYEPFFTTKATGQGKGLGLFITRGIVKSYEGSIHVETKIGEGTTFKLTLPIASD